MTLKASLLFIITLISSWYNPFKDPQQFIYPLKLTPSLSANFGELRSDHFHSGLDMKTNGGIGAPVLAAATGYVYRISITPGGFGKALYVRHPNGYSTVYGHLDRFTAEIEEWVTQNQYEKKSFTIHLYPEKERFALKQGDVIAYSGNSGSSQGPHLHFEVRRSENENPVNPLIFNLGIEDNIKPVIDQLAVYPLSPDATINGFDKPLYINVHGSHGNYYVRSDETIKLTGKIGFGIRSHDFVSNASNRCGIYRLELDLDSSNIFTFEINSFSYNETRYINSHIDYKEKVNRGRTFQRAYTQPNDKLPLYKNLVNKGIVDFNDDEIHHLRFTVIDSHGNSSILPFRVKAEVTKTNLKYLKPKGEFMHYARQNRFRAEGFYASVPAGALYDSVYINYTVYQPIKNLMAPIHAFGDESIPLHTAMTISVKPNSIPPGLEGKMFLVKVSKEGKLDYIKGKMVGEGFFSGETRSFGSYSIALDTISPSVRAVTQLGGADISSRKSITFKISDSQSGVNSYNVTIDGQWSLFEYDPKTESLTGSLDPKRIPQGKRHEIEITVADVAGNDTRYKSDFYW